MLLVNSNSIVKLYAYGTNSHTIRVRSYHMRIRVWYVPYAYGMKYAYGTQQRKEMFCMSLERGLLLLNATPHIYERKTNLFHVLQRFF